MEMIDIGIKGFGGLIDLFRPLRHALAAAFGDLAHADDVDTVFLAALAALDQIGIVARLGEGDALLMEDAHILLTVGAGHVANLDHGFLLLANSSCDIFYILLCGHRYSPRRAAHRTVHSSIPVSNAELASKNGFRSRVVA